MVMNKKGVEVQRQNLSNDVRNAKGHDLKVSWDCQTQTSRTNELIHLLEIKTTQSTFKKKLKKRLGIPRRPRWIL